MEDADGMNAAKTTSERVAKLRADRADLGLTRRDVYIHPDDWPEVLRFVAKLARKRAKLLAPPQAG